MWIDFNCESCQLPTQTITTLLAQYGFKGDLNETDSLQCSFRPQDEKFEACEDIVFLLRPNNPANLRKCVVLYKWIGNEAEKLTSNVIQLLNDFGN